MNGCSLCSILFLLGRWSDRYLGIFHADLYKLPEQFDVHPPGDADATLLGRCYHGPSQLASLLAFVAMLPVRYDVDMPPLTAVIVEKAPAPKAVQQHGHCDGIMERRAVGEAEDFAVTVGEEQEDFVE